jgi:AcrR family transcriptional regulator
MNARRLQAAELTSPQPAPRPAGRPRSEECRQRILSAARALLDERGLRSMTMEAIAERAGTSKVTVYRWWSHKAAVVLDAMRAEVAPRVRRRESLSPLESLRCEMKSLCRFLQGPIGRLLVGIVAEGAVDAEISDAYRRHWVKPRRDTARTLIARAVEAGELMPWVDVEVTMDALFGPLYYRFLIKHAPLNVAFAESVFEGVMLGMASPKARAALGLRAGSSGLT